MPESCVVHVLDANFAHALQLLHTHTLSDHPTYFAHTLSPHISPVTGIVDSMAQTGLRSARCPALSSQAELDSYLLTHFSSQELFDPQAYNGLTSIEDQSRYKMLLYRADTMLANNSEHEVPVQLLGELVAR